MTRLWVLLELYKIPRKFHGVLFTCINSLQLTHALRFTCTTPYVQNVIQLCVWQFNSVFEVYISSLQLSGPLQQWTGLQDGSVGWVSHFTAWGVPTCCFWASLRQQQNLRACTLSPLNYICAPLLSSGLNCHYWRNVICSLWGLLLLMGSMHVITYCTILTNRAIQGKITKAMNKISRLFIYLIT